MTTEGSNMSECPGQIWGDCPTKQELESRCDRYRSALQKIYSSLGGSPDAMVAYSIVEEAFAEEGSNED